MPSPLTAAERQRYLEHQGACCPKCQSRQLDSERPTVDDHDDHVVTAFVECTTCRYTWRDVYRLADIQEV